MKPPRVGFLGVGWIGLHRMEAAVDARACEVVAVCDPDPDAVARACRVAPGAQVAGDLDALLDHELDGVVIATPSARHAEQAIAALDRGVPVFCQKPLGRTAAEVRTILDAARRADRRLDVDLSYRRTAALTALREVVASGDLGRVYAMDLTFHNAWGPDKAWFRDPVASGGGCVVDLGIHLVDAALWLLGFPEVREVRCARFARGEELRPDAGVNEDFATAELLLETGTRVRVACSWFLPAGRPAIIELSAWGDGGGAGMRNVDGSFYDFVAERWEGTRTKRLAEPPDAWGGRALIAWARSITSDPSFDPAAEQAHAVARTLDRMLGRA